MDFPPSPEFSLTKEEQGSHAHAHAEWTSEAMDHSSLAANYMQEQHYNKALASYQQALLIYRRDDVSGAIADRCNAAVTLHNMGLLHKRCKRYNHAIACLEEAEVLYRDCSSNTRPRDKGEGVCVEYLLAETLQNRANMHSKYHRNVPAAIDCHEEVVTMLLDSSCSPQQRDNKTDIATNSTVDDNEVFVRITDDQKVHLLSISLRSLGNLYLQQGEQDDALGAYQEALDMLRCRQSKHPTLNLQKKIASILLSMACVYFAQNELDQAVIALDECIANNGADQAHPDVIMALNNLGLAYEQKGDMGMATNCYEDMLDLRRRHLGENHVQVAEALITVANMLERQGNMTGALERYQESLEICRSALSGGDPSFGTNLAEVLSKISTLSIERGSVKDAVTAYQQTLTIRKENKGETTLDEARIFFEQAKSFNDKQSYHAAKDSLTETRHILQSISNDNERARQLFDQIDKFEASLNQSMSVPKDKDAPPLLMDRPANWGAIGEVAENIAEDVTVEIIDEAAEMITVEVTERRKILDQGENAMKVADAAPADPPLHLLPSADSIKSPLGGIIQNNEPPSPIVFQQIQIAEENESAIELQCITSKSNTSDSASTQSVTPESSLGEELSPFLEKGVYGLALVNQRMVLEVLDERETSSVPEEDIMWEEFSTSSLTTGLPEDASVGLNAYSAEHESVKGSPLESVFLPVGPTEPSSRGDDDDRNSDSSKKLEDIQGMGALRLPSSKKLEKNRRVGPVESTASGRPISQFDHDADLEYDASEDAHAAYHSPHQNQSEYAIFVEGSVFETENETTVFEATDLELTGFDVTEFEGPDSEFATEEDEHTDGREDIYWDEEENREVRLDSNQKEFPITSLFATPLGLEEQSIDTGSIQSGKTEEPPEEVKWQQLSPEKSAKLRKVLSSEPSPQKSSPSDVDLKKSPRNRLVKALARPFRRRSQMSTKLEPMPEEKVVEISEGPAAVAQRQIDFDAAGLNDDASSIDEEFARPIDYIKLRSISYDDTVSLMTVNQDDFLSKKSDNNSQWWLAVADFAEDFFSAKSIHNKSDFAADFFSESIHNSDIADENDSSGDDSDPFEDLSLRETADTQTETISITAESTGRDDIATYEKPPARGPIVVSIVDEVSSTAWKPPSMLSLSSKRCNSSPRIQTQINTLEKSLEQEKSDRGYYHENVATSLVALAQLRVERGDMDLAVDCILEALKIQKAIRNPQAMARSLHVLADIYCRQEQYDVALACYNDVHRIERRLFGPDHPESANTLNKIGRVFANQGMFYQAMEKHQQALQVLKACVGEDLTHPAVSQTLIHIGEVYYRERNSLSTIRNNADDYKKFIETGMLDIIARAHEDRGSYKMALGFFEEKLQLIKTGNNNFPQEQLAQILNNLGALSCKSGVFLEAIDYYEQALDIQVRRGCNEVDVATAKVLIGTVEYHLGQYRKSLNLLEGALKVFEKAFGNEHEVVADILYRIGVVKSALWHHDDAMEKLDSALRLQLKLFGEHDLDVLKTRLEICWIEVNQGMPENGVLHIKVIMKKQQDVVGKAHPIIADTLLLLGKVYLLTGNSSKAIKVLKESFSMRERFLGRDHPLQAETFHLIALEGIRREKFQHASGMCNSVLNIRRETLGERHIDVASTLSALGRCHTASGKFIEAHKCFTEALDIAQESVGENHPCVADIYVGKGIWYLRKCQFQAAEEAIEKGIDIYKTVNVHEEHVCMKESVTVLERVERDEMLCV